MGQNRFKQKKQKKKKVTTYKKRREREQPLLSEQKIEKCGKVQ